MVFPSTAIPAGNGSARAATARQIGAANAKARHAWYAMTTLDVRVGVAVGRHGNDMDTARSVLNRSPSADPEERAIECMRTFRFLIAPLDLVEATDEPQNFFRLFS
jgi:hypothetical protein